MALVDCPECESVVSDSASACPHCGHPNPGKVVERNNGAQSQPGPLWPVFVWAVGFLILGILLDVAVDVAAIAISGDWNAEYHLEWFETASFYATPLIGVFIGLARRHRHRQNHHGRFAIGLSLVLVLGVGFILVEATRVGAASQNSTPVAAESETTTTTRAKATTTTTSEYDRQIEEMQRRSECLEAFRSNPSNTDCDGAFRLEEFLLAYYWEEEYLPLWEEVRGHADAGDWAAARVTCELGRSGASDVSQRLLSWDDSSLRRIAIPWLQEMEFALTACAQGQWELVKESGDRINEYLEEASAS